MIDTRWQGREDRKIIAPDSMQVVKHSYNILLEDIFWLYFWRKPVKAPE